MDGLGLEKTDLGQSAVTTLRGRLSLWNTRWAELALKGLRWLLGDGDVC